MIKTISLQEIPTTLSQENLQIVTFPVGSLGCNCSIIFSLITSEAIIIDPGLDAPKVLKKINELQLKVKYLLHTHAHFDHIGHSDIIRKQTKASMHLHKDDIELYNNLPLQGSFFGVPLTQTDPIDQLINHEETFGFESPALKNLVKAFHTPGHTPGSCSFYSEHFKVPLLFSGDTLFARSIGRTDFPGGDFDTIKKSIKERLYTLPEETLCIPGHGETTTIALERRENPFVRK